MASIVSIIPIVLLFILMLGFKMAGHKSALLTLVVTVLLALFAASPLGMIAPEHAEDSVIALTGWAVVEGILKAVFPILIIILMAIYSYNILVESKQIEVIKRQFTSITDDKGLLVLLLVWGFGGLLEGMAGFGTAVAIPAAILIGLGFKPMFSALVSLIGNTVATGFGAVGVPVTTLCNEVAESGSASAAQICETSAFAIIQLAPLFIILPFIILTLTDKHNLIKNLIIALWVGVISVVVQFVEEVIILSAHSLMFGIEYAADQLIGFYHVAYLSDSLRHVLAQVLLRFILRLLVISRIGNVEDIVIVRYLVTVEDAG